MQLAMSVCFIVHSPLSLPSPFFLSWLSPLSISPPTHPFSAPFSPLPHQAPNSLWGSLRSPPPPPRPLSLYPLPFPFLPPPPLGSLTLTPPLHTASSPPHPLPSPSLSIPLLQPCRPVVCVLGESSFSSGRDYNTLPASPWHRPVQQARCEPAPVCGSAGGQETVCGMEEWSSVNQRETNQLQATPLLSGMLP